MKLLNLSIHNFGVFKGEHFFDLKPKKNRDGSSSNLIVFTGQNGVGKSTVFQALSLVFHGKLALGDRVSQAEYNEYLLSRFYRNKSNNTEKQNEAIIEVNFQYVYSGQVLNIFISRKWIRDGNKVIEELRILQGKLPPDIGKTEYQHWINELLPPGYSLLCFFNAEEFDTNFSSEKQNTYLNEILCKLLGLDIVKRLGKDLEYYMQQTSKGLNVDELRSNIVQQQQVVESLSLQLNIAQNDIDNKTSELSCLERKIDELESSLISEGGSYAEKRPKLEKRKKIISQELEKLSMQLKDLCSGLLPFIFAPELCQKLSVQLEKESDFSKRKILDKYWKEKIKEAEVRLNESELWKDKDISDDLRFQIINNITKILNNNELENTNNHLSLVHNIAEPEKEKLLSWINESIHIIPQQVKHLGEQIKILKKEFKEIDKELNRAPNDDILAPIVNDISNTKKSIVAVQLDIKKLTEKKGSIQYQLDVETRNYDKTSSLLESSESSEDQIELAQKSRLVLKTYYDSLIRHKIKLLEKELLVTFNNICRKAHLLRSVSINPENLNIVLEGTDGQQIGLNDFSAGENELYILSLLWALRKIGKKVLPLAMDMPFARLDDNHQVKLINDYLPFVSEQILLFVTDTELSANFLSHASSHISKIYSLNFNKETQKTDVTEEIAVAT